MAEANMDMNIQPVVINQQPVSQQGGQMYRKPKK